MAGAAAELATGRARVDALPLGGDGWELIAPGLHRSYRRGRKRLRAVEEEASVTNLHELRKRVKDLTYQLRLIRDVDRAMLEPLADHAHGLSDHLGDDHDLALLREEAQRRRNALREAGRSAPPAPGDRPRAESCSSPGSRSPSGSMPTSRSASRSGSRSAGTPGATASQPPRKLSQARPVPRLCFRRRKGDSHEGVRSRSHRCAREAAGADAGRRRARGHGDDTDLSQAGR